MAGPGWAVKNLSVTTTKGQSWWLLWEVVVVHPTSSGNSEMAVKRPESGMEPGGTRSEPVRTQSEPGGTRREPRAPVRNPRYRRLFRYRKPPSAATCPPGRAGAGRIHRSGDRV